MEGTFKLEGHWGTSFKALQEQEQQAYKSLNDEVNRLKSLKGLEGDAALTTLVGLQATDQFAPEDFTSLQSLIDLHAESHQALTHFLTDEELYKTFIIQTLALNQNWLSFIYSTHEKVTTSLDALALLNGLSVTVWGKTGADSLTPLHQTEAAPNATPRHILFTAAGKVGGVNPLQANHFNLLDTSPGLLKTPILSFEDVTSVDQSAYTSLGVSDISVVGAVAAFMEAERRTHDRRGVHRATVAPGYKIETDSNISGLNRDPARAFEITQDDSSHFWVGAPMVRDWNQAKAEVMEGAKVIQKTLSSLQAGAPQGIKPQVKALQELDQELQAENLTSQERQQALEDEELAVALQMAVKLKKAQSKARSCKSKTSPLSPQEAPSVEGLDGEGALSLLLTQKFATLTLEGDRAEVKTHRFIVDDSEPTVSQNVLRGLGNAAEFLEEQAQKHPEFAKYLGNGIEILGVCLQYQFYIEATLTGAGLGSSVLPGYGSLIGGALGLSAALGSEKAIAQGVEVGLEKAASWAQEQGASAEEGAKFSDNVYKAASFAGAALLLKQARGKIKPRLGKESAKTSASVMETATTSRAARWVAEGEVSQHALKLGKNAEGYVPTNEDILHAIRSARAKTGKGAYNFQRPTSSSTTTTTSTSSAKKPLMSTEFSKQSRSYIKDMESRSGMSIPFQQRIILKETLQKQKFDILEGIEAKKHKAPFKNPNFKDDLIKQWEINTKQEWPTSLKMNKKTNKMEPKRHDAHHIIPQQHGGPHEWWNMHPLEFGKHHQGGVHGRDSTLNQILKDVKK